MVLNGLECQIRLVEYDEGMKVERMRQTIREKEKMNRSSNTEREGEEGSKRK